MLRQDTARIGWEREMCPGTCDWLNFACITGLAEGFDTAIAEACFLLGLPYWAYIPCIDQCRYWSEDAIIKYENLLRHADKGELIYNGYYADNPSCMTQRDFKMVDDAEAVISLFNGDRKSGTGKTVAYANRCHKSVKSLWNSWERYSEL